MENVYLAYAFGVLTVIFILLAVGSLKALITINKLSKSTDDINQHLNELERHLDTRFDEFDRRIEYDLEQIHRRYEEVDRHVNSTYDNLISEIDKRTDDSIGYTDSRIDKLENKIKLTFGTVSAETNQ